MHYLCLVSYFHSNALCTEFLISIFQLRGKRDKRVATTDDGGDSFVVGTDSGFIRDNVTMMSSEAPNGATTIGSLGMQWNPKHLEIKTRSVEKTLEPLVMQVKKAIGK